jgi:hypothetical protein
MTRFTPFVGDFLMIHVRERNILKRLFVTMCLKPCRERSGASIVPIIGGPKALETRNENYEW